jgi:hypothetical protein
MFVAREQHLKTEARDLATRSWLIPESFYDEWLEAFAKRYAPRKVADADLQERSQELKGTFKSVLASQESQSIEALEARMRACEGDVYKLRDTLLAAVKDLSSPRQKLGMGGGAPLTEEAIEALKKARQIRLRDIVMRCLKGIWTSGVGGEVLRLAIENVRHMIHHFELKADDICTARQGLQWSQLKDLMEEIEEAQPLPLQDEEDPTSGSQKTSGSRRSRAIEGKGTKTLLEVALGEMQGHATTQEIFEWVESHPELTAEHSRMRVNQGVNKVNGKDVPVWHTTIRTVLSKFFDGARIKGRDYVWHAKGEPPAGLRPAPQAIADAESKAIGQRRPRKEAPTKRRSADGGSKGTTSETPAAPDLGKRKRVGTPGNQNDGDGSSLEKKRSRKAAPAKIKQKADDPLALMLDQAIESARRCQEVSGAVSSE